MKKKDVDGTETLVDSPMPEGQVLDVGERKIRVRYDDKQLVSHYANVANVGMSRDELTLLFGTNQTWGAVGEEIVIQLSSRIIMTPSVAKNLLDTLQRVLQEYEARLGKISCGEGRGDEIFSSSVQKTVSRPCARSCIRDRSPNT